jgi:hypothetical protein
VGVQGEGLNNLCGCRKAHGSAGFALARPAEDLLHVRVEAAERLLRHTQDGVGLEAVPRPFGSSMTSTPA